MSPELGIRKARGEVSEHHHRRQERHDPLIPEAEGGHAPAVDDHRADEITRLRAVESCGLGVGLVLEQPGVDRVASGAELRQMVARAPDIEVVGIVDGRLGLQGESLLGYCLTVECL